MAPPCRATPARQVVGAYRIYPHTRLCRFAWAGFVFVVQDFATQASILSTHPNDERRIADLEAYLAHAGDAADALQVAEQIRQLREN